MNSESDYQDDFTVENYSSLLDLARANYRFVNYQQAVLSNDRFVIWRHDVDQSLNRALRLAAIEAGKGISATYFLNPHCNFYSLLEEGQHRIVKEIAELGHEVGLHFDAHFYKISSEAELGRLVEREVGWLKEWFGVEVTAFSFHNPDSFLLTCEKEEYGGLINCYSQRFKKQVPYCSDSNGYWRHRRLHDVLEAATDPCLHVLTHPECWQESSMPPRARFFRSIDGRAAAVMRQWDDMLAVNGRRNPGSLMPEFEYLKKILGHKAELLDYRWLRGESASVYVDLWGICEAWLVKFCRIWLRKVLRIRSAEAEALLDPERLGLQVNRVFAVICGKSWDEVSGSGEAEFLGWQRVRDQLVHGRRNHARDELERGLAFLVRVLRRLRDIGDEASLRASARGTPDVGGGMAWLSENRIRLGIDEGRLLEYRRVLKPE